MASVAQRVVLLPGGALGDVGVVCGVQPSTPSPSVKSMCTPQNVASTAWRTTVCPQPPQKPRRVAHPTSQSPTSSSSGPRTPATMWPTPHGTPMGFSVMTPKRVFFVDTPTGPLTRKISEDNFALSPRAREIPTRHHSRSISSDSASVSTPRSAFGVFDRSLGGETLEHVLEVPETPSPPRDRSTGFMSPGCSMTPDEKATVTRTRLFSCQTSKAGNIGD
eukprot:CAMPEP_0194506604 /NCGR_PEP_ID=MMETSP0253-20130528/35074_1 /TAXON_ID=2966 /ORGANISM="Noctiluca scintillans" /LENGTH=219 /DNA_ID=CAMNT_0039349361 /DNA_START=1 /DNA_END=660 /DNA_ORIENTATION=+